MESPVFHCEKLSKNYQSLQAVSDLNLKVLRGQVFGLLGPNGSGKTTTLAMALGVLKPSSGYYSWFASGDSHRLRRRIGSLLETPRFYPWLNAVQNLQITATIRGVEFADIDRVLQRTGLYERRKSRYDSFSLGMKQRLAIASCLLGDPEVLVLDEPTNGIDAEGIAEIRDIILEQRKAKKTILLASHILDEVEKVCTHVAVLKQGQLLQAGSIEEVLGADKWFELKAANKSELLTALKGFHRLKDVVDEGEFVKVVPESSLGGEELNRYLFDKNIVLSELKSRQQSLEQHFLEVMKK